MRVVILAGALLSAFAVESVQAQAVATFGDSFSVSRILADDAPTDTIVFSFGIAAVADGPPGSFGWLNLVGPGGEWLIRNTPIPLSGFSMDTPWLDWALEAEGVVGTAPVTLSAIVHATPFVSTPVPDGDWTTIELTPGTLAYFYSDYTGLRPLETTAAPTSAPLEFSPLAELRVADYHFQTGVVGQFQFWNECAPTATATSIYWLGERHGFSSRLPDDPIHFVTDIARLMIPGWNPVDDLPDKGGRINRGFPGVQENQMLAGKRGYLGELGFSGGVTSIGGWSSATILDWLKRGYNVEIGVNWDGGGAHVVTVTGMILLEDGRGMLTVLDPLVGNKTQNWVFTRDGRFPLQKASFRVAFGETVPEPGTWAMMIAGFGLVGGMARRRRALAPA